MHVYHSTKTFPLLQSLLGMRCTITYVGGRLRPVSSSLIVGKRLEPGRMICRIVHAFPLIY